MREIFILLIHHLHMNLLDMNIDMVVTHLFLAFLLSINTFFSVFVILAVSTLFLWKYHFNYLTVKYRGRVSWRNFSHREKNIYLIYPNKFMEVTYMWQFRFSLSHFSLSFLSITNLLMDVPCAHDAQLRVHLPLSEIKRVHIPFSGIKRGNYE